MYCKNCGNKIGEAKNFCPNCGNKIKSVAPVSGPTQSTMMSPNSQNVNNNQINTNNQERNTLGWGILGFLMPVVGLILFAVWRYDRPKAAKSSGIGALINTILILIFVIFFIFIIIEDEINRATDKPGSDSREKIKITEGVIDELTYKTPDTFTLSDYSTDKVRFYDSSDKKCLLTIESTESLTVDEVLTKEKKYALKSDTISEIKTVDINSTNWKNITITGGQQKIITHYVAQKDNKVYHLDFESYKQTEECTNGIANIKSSLKFKTE